MEAGPSDKEESAPPSAVQDDGLENEGHVHEFFTSVPPFSEAASYLSQTTSYLNHHLSNLAENHVPEHASTSQEQLLALTSEKTEESYSSNHYPSLESCSTSSEPSPQVSMVQSIHDRDFRRTVATLFQDTAEHMVKSSVRKLFLDTTELMGSSHIVQRGSSFLRSLISRSQKTVNGSAADIGWLQQAPEMPPVEDGTKRFMELLESIRNGEHKLPNSMIYLLVPGLFSNHFPLYFVSTKTYFSRMGLTCHIAKIHSEASVENNAKVVKDYVEDIYWGSRKPVLLLGHSKGGVDAAAALSMYWSDLKDKVSGLVLVQSPYAGSPIASDILREGQLGDYVNFRNLVETLICKMKGDIQALEDLTYERRKEFLKKYQLPRELPVVSFHTEASIDPGVFSSFSHVAHAELPVFPNLTVSQSAKVPVVIPFAALMAACAHLLRVRYDEKSDGLVTRRDAEVPGSVVVQPNLKLDHAWMVYSSLNDELSEANASQVCEALLTFLIEVQQRKKRAIYMKEDEDI